MANVNPLSPNAVGHGQELSGEEFDAIVSTPLQAQSAIMNIPGVQVHPSSVPLHLPIMTEFALDDSSWVGPNAPLVEVDPNTAEVVLLARGLKSLKVIVKLSSESIRSSDSLGAGQTTITNQLVKAVDKALLQGNATAGITGLLAAAGTTQVHSRTVADAVLNSTTTVTSATAAFVAGDVGKLVSGAGIPAGSKILSRTNATTVVLDTAATATAAGVSLTIASTTAIYDELVDALTAASDNYANPTSWLINTRTIGVLRKMKDSQGHPLLEPDLTQAGADMILGRRVVPAPQAPVGSATLIDPSTVHIGLDLDGRAQILMETFAQNDQVGLKIVSRYDVACTNPLGLVVINGIV